MKKYLLILLLAIFCTSVYAQDYEHIFCDSEDSAQKLAESMLKNTRNPYVFVESDLSSPSSSRRLFTLDYIEQTDNEQAGRKIRITFQIYLIGANPALEIPGTPLYQLNSINAPYLDVFPIWKAYFSPDADAEALSTKTSGETVRFENAEGRKSVYKFAPNSQRSGYWILRMSL